MRFAVYPSVLYGEDFIVESIRSILPHVDRVFVVLTGKPWGDTKGVTYKGDWIPWPEKFDRTRERVEAMDDPRIKILDAYFYSPWNRWGDAVDFILAREELIGGDRPSEIVLIDPDCVFTTAEAKRVFGEWDNTPSFQWAQPRQIELWRTPAWQVIRPRSMVSLHRGDLRLIGKVGVQKPKTYQLQGYVHNFGFCVSPKNMRWKHLTALAFSPVIKESMPVENWYEEKWLRWTPETRNLEVSVGSESSIPKAIPYNLAQLPESIQKRLKAGEWSSGF